MVHQTGIKLCALALLHTVLGHVVFQTFPNPVHGGLSLKFLKNYTSEVLGPAYDKADTIYFMENFNNSQFMSKYTISTNSFSRLLEEPIGNFKDINFSSGIIAGNFWFIADEHVYKFDLTTNTLVDLGYIFQSVYLNSTFVVEGSFLFYVSQFNRMSDDGNSHIVRFISKGNQKTETNSVATFKREIYSRVFLTSNKSEKIYAIVLDAGYMYEFDKNIDRFPRPHLTAVHLKGVQTLSLKYILPVENFILGVTKTKVFYIHLQNRATTFQNLSTPFPESSDYLLKPIYVNSTQTIYVFAEEQTLKAVDPCQGFLEKISPKTVHATKWSSVTLKCDVTNSPKSTVQWFRGREPAVEKSIDSSAELVLNHGSVNQTTIYKCVAESICGVQEQLIDLQVSARFLPVWEAYGATVKQVTAKSGSNASLDCYPARRVPFNRITTVWLRNEVFWETSLDTRVHTTNTGLVILGAKEDDSGKYTCLLDTSDITSYGVENKSANVEFELNVKDDDPPKIIYINATTPSGGLDKGTESQLPVNYILFALILIPIILIGSYWFYKVRNQNLLGLTAQEIREFRLGRHTLDEGEQNSEQLAETRPYDINYELPAYAFQIQRETTLGEGQFGVVYKGVLKLDDKMEEAAFKTAKNVDDGKQHLMSLLSELKILIYIGHHPSIIRLFGAYTRQLNSGILYVALEFCTNGSLERILRSGKHASELQNQYESLKCITNAMQLNWSLQITSGMNYLASKKVIHSDLATRNILVAQDLSTRITDFGLSRRLQNYENYVKTGSEPLPWRWMALESLEYRNFSTESDVWSFGVTLWEIYSMGKIPFHNQTWSTMFIEQLKAGDHLPRPPHASEEVFSIMKQCWELDAAKRPKFKDLEHCLQQINYRNQNIIYK